MRVAQSASPSGEYLATNTSVFPWLFSEIVPNRAFVLLKLPAIRIFPARSTAMAFTSSFSDPPAPRAQRSSPAGEYLATNASEVPRLVRMKDPNRSEEHTSE